MRYLNPTVGLALTLVIASMPRSAVAQDVCVDPRYPWDVLVDSAGTYPTGFAGLESGAVPILRYYPHPLAEKYAPRLRFEAAETEFPINPLFMAFNGRDDDGDGLTDFDPDELLPGVNGRPSRDFMRERWREIGGGLTVFYRIRELNSSGLDEMWQYLRSDEQAWRRIGNAAVNDALLAEDLRYLTIEYFFYYMEDTGLQGHDWDLEAFTVIRPESDELAERFRLYIAAGHSPQVANNIYLSTKDEIVDLLVEYGDHSNTTDVAPYGEFLPGVDVNWHVADAWGLRDIQSKSGLGATGRWSPEMASPRDTADYWSYEYPRQDRLARGEQVYQLLPAELFECLFATANAAPPRPEPASAGAIGAAPTAAQLETIGTYLRALRQIGLGTPTADSATQWEERDAHGSADYLTTEQKREVVWALQAWDGGLYMQPETTVNEAGVSAGPETVRDCVGRGCSPVVAKVGIDKVFPWKNKHYRHRPARHFKAHLFRPAFGSQQRFTHWLEMLRPAVAVYPNRGWMYQVSVDVPAFFVPVRVPGFLQIQAGWYCGRFLFADCNSAAVSLMHTQSYSQVLSWYARVSWIPKLAEVDALNGRTLDGADPSDVLFGGGVALAFRPIRLNLGIATDARLDGPGLGRTSFEIMLSAFRIDF